jgi:hypothetical protein
MDVDRGPVSRLGMLPDEDRAVSPHTGWTRAHWEHIADHLLVGAARHATPDGAYIHIPGARAGAHGRRFDGLEGFARTFLLAAYRLRGAYGDDPLAFVDRYVSGLDAGSGTRRSRWPTGRDSAKHLVEATSVAIALSETRPWIWDQLEDRVRQQVAAWLGSSAAQTPPANNWLMFRIVISSFLESIGDDQGQGVEEVFERLDALYRGHGWYTDGTDHNFDHYNSWAMHFYAVAWRRICGERVDGDRWQVLRSRLRHFADGYSHLFAADGAPLLHGRSLVYRFAACAALNAGAVEGVSGLDPGLVRRTGSGALRHFVDRGAITDGVLTLGWHGPFSPLAQAYSGPASPYWACKAFVSLAAAPAHPLWTAVERPLPVERGDFVRALAAPGFLAIGSRADGIVRIASHRSDHFPFRAGGSAAWYRKLSYSTHTSPNVSESGGEAGCDAQITLRRPDGTSSTRARFHLIAIADRFASSVHYPLEWDGRRAGWRRSIRRRRTRAPSWAERIETTSVGIGVVEVRVHHVAGPPGSVVEDGGYALAGGERPVCVVEPTCAAVATLELRSAARALYGFESCDVEFRAETNPFGAQAAAPLLRGRLPSAGAGVFVSEIALSGPETGFVSIEHVEVRGRQVHLRCSDGSWVLVCVLGPAANVELGGHRIAGPVRLARTTPAGELIVAG